MSKALLGAAGATAAIGAACFGWGLVEAGLYTVRRFDLDILPPGGRDIRILHVSDPVPGSPIAVRGTLDPDLIDTIRDFLLAFDDDTYFYGIHGDATVRYVPTSIDDFAELIALHRRMQAG